MSENEKEIFEGEGTFENISREDFFINQNNIVDSFGKCPGCDNETLNLETRKCDCGYSLDHNIPYNIDKVEEKTKKILTYSICSCGNKKGVGSKMCKECYGRNKVNGNF